MKVCIVIVAFGDDWIEVDEVDASTGKYIGNRIRYWREQNVQTLR